jgi:hypothetical protein
MSDNKPSVYFDFQVGPIYDETVDKVEAKLKAGRENDCAIITFKHANVRVEIARSVLERALHEVALLREVADGAELRRATSRKK